MHNNVVCKYLTNYKLQELAKKIAKISVDCQLELEEERYVDKFKPFLMDVVFAWCKGATFLKICKMTDIFEGKYEYLRLIFVYIFNFYIIYLFRINHQGNETP